MNRAERRRAMRAQGQKRASSKKGRRASIRVGEQPQRFDNLARAGFTVAVPKLELPGR